MEKNFTFRFYELSKNSKATPDLLDVIRKISLIPSAKGREKQLAQDFVVRLETLEDDSADAIVGELTRCQGTNLPSEIDGDKRKALTAKSLGHGIVFRLNHKKGFLGIQYDQRILTPGRLLEYVASFNANAIYSIAPIIDKKKLGSLQRRPNPQTGDTDSKP